MIVDLVIGCRPNFVKASAIIEAANCLGIKVRLLRTGQHTDVMSDPFFKELGLPKPAWDMCVQNLRPAERLGDMVNLLGAWWSGGGPRPDYVMVVGDTDSTLAGALAAKKCGFPLVHVEAGLRCGDVCMQEEINRKAVDSISDILYTSTEGAVANLEAEGHMPWTIKFVGNVMVDTLYRFINEARRLYGHPFGGKEFALLTLHRAENVDTSAKMDEIITAVGEIAENIPVIFPKHPRNHVRLYAEGLHMVPPMGYFEFISTMSAASFVLTDSGGVQEETTALGVPCVTIRPNTERPETTLLGTNVIAGTRAEDIIREARAARVLPYAFKNRKQLPLWDGQAAKRILEDLIGRSACKI